MRPPSWNLQQNPSFLVCRICIWHLKLSEVDYLRPSQPRYEASHKSKAAGPF